MYFVPQGFKFIPVIFRLVFHGILFYGNLCFLINYLIEGVIYATQYIGIVRLRDQMVHVYLKYRKKV